jgi:hypothetical protein
MDKMIENNDNHGQLNLPMRLIEPINGAVARRALAIGAGKA